MKKAILCFLSGFILTGCIDLTNQPFRPAPEPEPPATTQKANSGKSAKSAAVTKPQARVYALRGLFGIFSTGMDSLAKRANQELGLSASSLPHTQYTKLTRHIIKTYKKETTHRPIVLVGHSLGADDSINTARVLAQSGIEVDLLVTLDAVNPKKIPPNVRKVVNLYVPHPLDKAPMLRGIPVKASDPSKTVVRNINIKKAALPFSPANINHMNLDEVRDVQNYVLSTIAESLP